MLNARVLYKSEMVLASILMFHLLTQMTTEDIIMLTPKLYVNILG